MAYFTHEDDVQQEPQELSQEQSDETKVRVRLRKSLFNYVLNSAECSAQPTL